ncbi:MAG: hypothetical protein COY80_00780 [Candidatus Pacebacteria bacterium CG_4_10_14_0_8_um_filter_42_14]|nr:MAG: hypothetical protein COY80_00780 [Candidatus Pacebacteria bacterium CG_4_10_14_0_8_um_filter_42_14]
MKKNSQILLLSLFTQQSTQAYSLTVPQLRRLVPDLTDSGFRSLLHVLEKKLLISSERIQGRRRFYLTNDGKNALVGLFPSLDTSWQSWDGSWVCLVFLQAPKGDLQFRYLRSLLLEYRAVAISRGVYLYPRQLPAVVLEALQRLYIGSVLCFGVAEWQFGTERPIVVEKYTLESLLDIYSGVSKEARQLLSIENESLRLTVQQKSRIASLFDRLLSALTIDVGFMSYYFPGSPRGSEVLALVQRLFTL